MFDTGRILISVRRLNHERALSITVRSSRTEAVARWLTGCDIRSRDVESRLATLHALCPEAHRTAWKSALAAAQGTVVRAAPLSLQREILWEHLRFLTFDAPRTLGTAPLSDPAALGHLRNCLEAAPDSAGAAALIRPFITRFVTGMPPERLNEITTRQALTRWAQSTSTAPARMLQALLASDIGNTPLSTRNFTASPAEAARWLKAPDFVATPPTAEGVSQATGAFVREAEHPLIRNLSSAPTLLTLFAARLTELLTLTATASPISLVHALPTGDHEGTALVATARGTLLYQVSINEKQRAERVRIVTPTDWNFAPDGPCRTLLSALPFTDAADFAGKARWVTTGFDPCVPCNLSFHLTEAGDA